MKKDQKSFRYQDLLLDGYVLKKTIEIDDPFASCYQLSKEFNRIYLSCPEAVRETLMDSTRTLAKHLTGFYSKIENP